MRLPKIIYVLVFDQGRLHEQLMILSATSLKEFHPDVEIVCATDQQTKNVLKNCNSSLVKWVDRWLVCGDVTGNARQKSRMIKTSLRRRIQGKYLFLDTDTIVVRPLEKLLTSMAKIAMVQDQFLGHPYFGFPGWLEQHYLALGWKYPTRKYFNSGVMLVADCEQTHNLYAEWEQSWKRTHERGLYQDQPALNYALEKTGVEVEELSLQFNAMIQVDERYRLDARILHFFFGAKSDNKIPVRFISEYQRLINMVSEGHPITGKEIVAKMHNHKALSGTLSWERQYQAGNILGALELLSRQTIRKVLGRIRREIKCLS